MRTRTIVMALMAGTWLGVAGAARADDQPPPEQHEGHQRALAGCEGKSDGDSCSFTSRHGDSIEGKCQNDREGKLACHPPHMHGHHGPPPQGE